MATSKRVRDLIAERRRRTGENYTTARRAILAGQEAEQGAAQTDLDRLVALAEQLGLINEDLFYIVHDAVQEVGLSDLNSLDDEDDQEDHITAAEIAASDINNGGLREQIEYLLSVDSAETVEQIIRGVLVDAQD